MIGTPGVLDPRTGDLRLAVNLPAWHEGVHDALRADLGRPVTIENDVNLAAMAERAAGAAQGTDDFVLVWIGVGLGLATMLGGRLHRGVGGAAGEIGYLPVPGVPLPQDITHPATGAFQSLVGAQAVLPLAAGFGFEAMTAAGAVRPPLRQRRARRARCAARGGVPGRAGQQGRHRRGRHLRRAGPWARGARRRGGPGGRDARWPAGSRPRSAGSARPSQQVVPTGISGGPVLRGAILAAVDQARAELLASVAN